MNDSSDNPPSPVPASGAGLEWGPAPGASISLPRLADYEAHARVTMPPALFDRLFGGPGSATWLTAQNNLDGFRKIGLRPSVLTDVLQRSTATSVLGESVSLPVMLAPVGTQKRAHPDAELATVRAAGRAGALTMVSTASSYSLEEIAEVATGPIWFQLYLLPVLEEARDLIRRAEASGYTAVVVTVDSANAPVDRRRNDPTVWNARQVELPQAHGNFRKVDLADSVLRSAWHGGGATWEAIDWLTSITSLPVVLKGIQTAEDAERSIQAGASAIVVSNHGGNGLEDATATVEQLYEIATAVDARMEIYLDGGVRKGIDVLKALAIGARAVAVGRPIYWGLAAGGEAGVYDILECLRSELDIAMAHCGVRDLSAIDRTLVRIPHDWQV